MKNKNKVLLVAVIFLFSSTLFARDAARDLRKLVGYTIIAAATVQKIVEKSYGEKYLVLDDGSVFKVSGLLLGPLPMTDVIVFAKKLPDSLTSQYQGKVPDFMLFQIKLLIDNEIHDAEAAR